MKFQIKNLIEASNKLNYNLKTLKLNDNDDEEEKFDINVNLSEKLFEILKFNINLNIGNSYQQEQIEQSQVINMKNKSSNLKQTLSSNKNKSNNNKIFKKVRFLE